MKALKKLLAVAVSLVMVVGMMGTAMADETTYSITINDSRAGHSYAAYQILTGDYTVTTDKDTQVQTKVLTNVKWGTNVASAKGTAGQAVSSEDMTTLSGLSNTDYSALAAYVNFNSDAVATTTTQTNGTYVLSGLASGYYLVKDSLTDDASEDDYVSNYVVKIVGESVTASPKGDKPSSYKKVDDKDDSNTTEDSTSWHDSADYDIGDSVPFQLTGTLPSNYAEYTTYAYTFHDVQSNGLNFNSDSVKVYANNNGTQTEITAGYSVVTKPTDECTFEIVFTNLKSVTCAANITSATKIQVEYTSTLTTDAVLGSLGNPNEMYLEYSNNPNGDGTGKTTKDKVIVFTYKVEVDKFDEDGTTALTGATFKLYKFEASTDGTASYNGVLGKWVEKSLTTSSNGTVFTATGIDDGVYKIVEVTPPAGYNKADDIIFTVAAEHDADSDNPQLKTLTGTDADTTSGNAATFTVISEKYNDDTSSNAGVKTGIVNHKGSSLPETGGMGTTLFYIVGGVLMVGAAVLLITKKRMQGRE